MSIGQAKVCVVIFEKGENESSAGPLLDAIRQLRGVKEVEWIERDYITEKSAKILERSKLVDRLYALCDELRETPK